MASGESGKRKRNFNESDENSIQVENITYFESKNQSKFSKKPNTTCQIFRGKLENGTKAFIRKFEVARVQQKDLEFQRDIELLREPERTSHMHKSFIHYFCFIKHGEFYYVATEWCICSVEDLYDIRRNGHNWEGNEIDTKLIKEILGGKKELLRQATEGVAFLHAMGFVHRNLKPSNFLIAQLSRLDREGFKYLVKVSDFRMSKHLGKQPNHSGQRGSDGWISPYPPKNDPQEIKTHPSEDVFILGCFFHYVLTNGKHPFGDNGIERELNVKKPDYKVYLAKWKPEIEEIQAISLVKDMIKYDPEERPALKTILGRAYFLPDDYYKLYDLQAEVKPGLCVIFNQETFDNKDDNREGTNKDAEELNDVFKEMGFDVENHKNLTAKQLCNEIEKLREIFFSNYASLVVCILSHGDEGTVFGTDGDQVSIEDVKKQFNNFNCRDLIDKPKIWIIQACQGNQLQEDLEKSIKSLTPKKPESIGNLVWLILTRITNYFFNNSVKQEIQRQQVILKPPDIPRPSVSDVLDIRATVPGFLSYRNANTGSTLIRNLCKQLRAAFLKEDGEQSNRHLEDVLKMVQKSISKEIGWLPATKIDWESLGAMKKRIEENIEILEEEKATNMEERIKAEKNKLTKKDVTEKDVTESGNKINLTFKKIFDEEKQKSIFVRPCHQTIEWRSTLMNFIRFEKK